MSYESVAPFGGAVPPLPPALPPLPALPGTPSAAPVAPAFGQDTAAVTAVPYYPGYPPPYYGPNPNYGNYPPIWGYPPPYQGPDVWDGLRDIGQGLGDGLGRVGDGLGRTLPVVGRHVVDGGSKAIGVIPAIARGIWTGITWVGEKLWAAGSWLFGGLGQVGGRLKREYFTPVPYTPMPYPPGYWPLPWPPAVVVEKGDTLRGIARDFLGDERRWTEIYALNADMIRQAGGLRAGMVLRLPGPVQRPLPPLPGPLPRPQPQPAPVPVEPKPQPAPEPVEPKPQPRPPRAHTVRKGDTLWSLAERYYGDAHRWREIWQANRSQIENPHWIYPGQVLKIPR